jgi:hypothetical protein
MPKRRLAVAPVAPAAPSARHQALRDGLLATVDLLKRRRAAEVAAGYLDGYVDLQWMEWNGGSLRLTVTGQNVCRQLSAGMGG